MAKSLAGSCKMAKYNSSRIGSSNYKVIRYEDLTADTAAVMKEIALFLNICWDDCLLIPTVNSQPAKANTMYKEHQVTGRVRRSVEGKWHGELNADEKRVVCSLLPEAKTLGYIWDKNTLQYLSMFWCRLRMRL